MERVRLKAVADRVSEEAKDGLGLPYIGLDAVESWTGRLLGGGPADAAEGTRCEAGDVLFGKLRPYLAKVHLVTQPSVCGSEFIAMRPGSALLGRFLRYALSTEQAVGLATAMSYGVKMPRVSPEAFMALEFLLPPVEQQVVAADFLDAETAQVDELVADKERFIELLSEKRSALITQAVTKGLQQDARVKDSGVEWLGKVPAGWAVEPLGARYRVQLGKMLDSSRITGHHLRPYLRNANIQWDRIVLDDLAEMDFDEGDRRTYRLWDGDLLVCEGGDVGKAAVWRHELAECYYQKALHRLRPIDLERDWSRFLYYCLEAAARGGRFEAGGNTATIGHLTAVQLRRYRWAFPPLAEQRAIADYLDRGTTLIDELVDETRRSIELLKEYRTALISAAVTGQIDVSAYAGPEGDAA